ncbi:transcriptional activator of glycolytic enzymes-domain-containing protein [Pseudomassariella vexata]|uniref:Transcriptional activator of glycolytic enzymes-domain-containing protein n=1 Tax=Pseudomassariella vexata TaxID=1141098 RepID=A0A1Y2DR34_9PEZI|nr:transcriptional activator of glycolytic enzymes-domain-containing protein [Pseudomassariella vexata]ORY61721.1 transcriptional activator of glycolytic enzymes-domain-containing protein [Pseudomassariella vexata]
MGGPSAAGAGAGLGGSAVTTGGGAGTKRPAASELQRSAGSGATPSKRHATKSSAGSAVGAMSMSAAGTSSQGGPVQMPQSISQPILMPPNMVSEDQLIGRTPDQLIETILRIQAQHQQYVANISAQYDTINQQLNELRGSLAAFYHGQAASHQAAASQLQRSPAGYPEPPRMSRPTAVPVPAVLPQQQQQPPLGPPRLTPSHHNQRPSRPPPPQSPQAPHTDTRLVPKTGTAQSPQTPGPPAYDYRTVGTVEEVWKEYKEGMDGQPAIEELDATWGSRWRPEPRGRTWYSRRKVIWDKIKEYIADGMDDESAVREVEKLRDGGTINKLIRMLQEERKEKGIPDDNVGA